MARAVRTREISCVELLDAHVARYDARNGELNAIVLPRLEAAREEAAAADAAIARREALGPLHGVPFTVKEIIDVAGMRSTNGSSLQAERIASKDAAVVRRTRNAGAILLGKTNLSEFSAFWDSVNNVYGTTRNPHDGTRTAGGSSGGEAAAVASAMSPFGIGSDLAGSIRAPAHWTGVYGLRTSRDAVPWAPHPPWPSAAGMQSFGTLGPLARFAEELDLVLATIAARRLPPAPVERFAVFEEDGLQPVSRACREAVRRAAAALAAGGSELVEDRLPLAAELRSAFNTIITHESAGAFSPLVAGREHELMPYNAELAEALRGFEPSYAAYAAAFEQIAAVEAVAGEWFERTPVALCPVAPDVAPPVGVYTFPPVDGEPTRPGGKLSLCSYASALGLPALAVPVMRSETGLPVGVQLIGRRGEERTLIALAVRIEEELGGWLDPDAG
ncbi:MAG: aspartyl-tRNA(Asn)/glutamyl-tRNA(Gln) amidotransferase subunit [Gaiellales bacterium]|nr:aspartyl-tRNA(Asn)/glutamyl-tRNA(Gln) amidotransferase subunit [Gaiellales bacterium]